MRCDSGFCRTRHEATRATRDGVTRLAALAMPQQHDLVRRSCAADRELTLLAAAAGMGRALFDEIADRAVADAIDASDAREPRSAAEFEGLVDSVRSGRRRAGRRAAAGTHARRSRR